MEDVFAKENIVHLGAAFYLAGFLFRDQIMLRALVIAGDIVYILYFLLAPAEPLWGGVFWSTVFVLVNGWMIGRIIADRTEFRMGEEERRLYHLLATLTPGEFRQLVRRGQWLTAPAPTVLTEEGRPLARLYYVLGGTIAVDKTGRHLDVTPPAFIGEVAFLTSGPASATVTLAAGSRYIAWDSPSLRRLQLRAPSLGVALAAALNRDMAMKVARS